jgi:uncharacterized membrane protein YqhA
VTERKPWFLVMRPQDANRPASQWVRAGAASRGKVVALPIAKEGWLALFAFIAALVAAPLTIWLGLFLSGRISAALAVAATVVVDVALIAAFIALVRSRMTRLPSA